MKMRNFKITIEYDGELGELKIKEENSLSEHYEFDVKIIGDVLDCLENFMLDEGVGVTE